MIELCGADGLPVLPENGVWTIEEARRYEVRNVDAVFWDGQQLPSPIPGVHQLDVGHRVGRVVLEWRRGTAAGIASCEVQARSEKLSSDLWFAMIEDLETHWPTVTVGFDGARHGAVGTTGVSAAWLAEALEPLLPEFFAAIHDLIGDLRKRGTTHVSEWPLRYARQIPRETVSWISRHPDTAQWLRPWEAAELRGAPPTVPLRRSVDTIDHPANRYIRWLLERAALCLSQAAGRLRSSANHEEFGPWCRVRATKLSLAASRLLQFVRKSTLSRVRAEPLSEGALSVLAGDPRYARVHRFGRRFTSLRFSLASSDTPASARPSYGVYELWCFLAMARALETVDGFQWRYDCIGNLLNPLGTGAGARATGETQSGSLQIHFNCTFRSYLARGTSDKWSVTGERRPDLVVSWQPRLGTACWLVADAKYRVGRNLVDAFESIHIYRDSLHWNAFGGAPRAGVLLSPASTSDTAHFFDERFRTEHRLGAFELRPELGKPNESPRIRSLVQWIVTTLGVPMHA